MIRKTLLILVVMLAPSAYGQFELPADVPRVRWSPDPLFSEEGFRLGFIMSFEHDWFWHYEGQLMLGSGTNPTPIMNGDCVMEATQLADSIRDFKRKTDALDAIHTDCFVESNPWPFSVVDRSLYLANNTEGASPVVVYYNQPVISGVGAIANGAIAALFTNTLDYVTKIWPVNPDFEAPQTFSVDPSDNPIANNVNLASGEIEGRVIKASMDHLLFKTYEIIVQTGVNGSNFRLMSVNDSAMFDHLVMTMFTGKIVRLHFLELFAVEGSFFSFVRGYSTDYRVTRVEILPDQVPMERSQP